MDDALAHRIRSLKFHDLSVDAFDRNMQGWAPQAEMMSSSYKYNLADINAAIALLQLDKLQHNTRRAALAKCYLNGLADTPFSPLAVPTWEHRHA
ncbi:MAG: UDP-4-amino-4-deoxy-L-arabinose--oxoglutarate aminotransferase [Sodalis sp.]|nr:MAG: UDP-4-amino-4-deoxy-L-arabinose--oxoglutarate aminotransferase [Sodalis sp.]